MRGLIELKQRNVKRYIKISAAVFAAMFVVYALFALTPYWGRVYVSEATRNAFAMENFFGQYEIPERVMLLEEPQDAFFHRVNLISKAQERIIMSSFAIHRGETSDIIAGALLAAADRGVEVTILVNAVVGGKPLNHMNALSVHENIDIYRFNRWQFFRPRYLNSAMHDKYLIVDDIFLILGGRNIGDKYYVPEGFSGQLSLDREVLVYNTDLEFEGSIVAVREYFYSKINSNRAFLYYRPRRNRNRAAEQLQFITLYKGHRWNVPSYGAFDYYASTVGVNRITLITNSIDRPKNDSAVAYNLLRITQNSSVIVAQSPYVVFTSRNLRTFAEAVEGRDFTLSTNSLASTPNLPAFSAYYVNRRNILNTGITIYEFQSTQAQLHGKTYLFDGRLAAIGSFNMNERSIRSDTESMLIIDSKEFHDITLAAINRQIEQSLRVNSNNRYHLNSDVEVGHVSLGKRILFTAAGYLFRPLRFMF